MLLIMKLFKQELPFRSLNYRFFEYPLGTTESLASTLIDYLVPGFAAQEHEYQSARFIKYLADHHGFTLGGLFSYYADAGYGESNLDLLENYLQTKDASLNLKKVYLDFAAKMMLDSEGDLSGTNIYQQLPQQPVLDKDKYHYTFDLPISISSYLPNVYAVRVQAGDEPRNFSLKLDSRNNHNSYIKVYHLAANQKTPGIQPVAVNQVNQITLASISANDGDIIYVLFTTLDEVMANARSKVILSEIMDLRLVIRHLEQELTHSKLLCTVQGLEGEIDRFHFDWSIRSEHGTDIGISASQVDENHLETTLRFEGERTGTPFDLEGTLYTIRVVVTDTETGEVIGRLSQDTEIGARTVEPGGMIPGL